MCVKQANCNINCAIINYHARVHFQFARDAIFCVYDNFWRVVFCAFNIYSHHLSLINIWISRKNLHVCEKDDAYSECFKIVTLQFAIGLAKYKGIQIIFYIYGIYIPDECNYYYNLQMVWLSIKGPELGFYTMLCAAIGLNFLVFCIKIIRNQFLYLTPTKFMSSL